MSLNTMKQLSLEEDGEPSTRKDCNYRTNTISRWMRGFNNLGLCCASCVIDPLGGSLTRRDISVCQSGPSHFTNSIGQCSVPHVTGGSEVKEA